MDGSFLIMVAIGLGLTLVLGRLKSKQPVAPMPQPSQPPGSPILDAILQILKQLGEQKPIAGIEATVKHPNSHITISLTKEDTHVSQP
jgi:hypothetical protein